MNQVEVFLAQIGKQHHVSDATVAAVGCAAPGCFGFDGNHAESGGGIENRQSGRIKYKLMRNT
jgi:hypothetical protein